MDCAVLAVGRQVATWRQSVDVQEGFGRQAGTVGCRVYMMVAVECATWHNNYNCEHCCAERDRYPGHLPFPQPHLQRALRDVQSHGTCVLGFPPVTPLSWCIPPRSHETYWSCYALCVFP
jgi:hypothetical protein